MRNEARIEIGLECGESRPRRGTCAPVGATGIASLQPLAARWDTNQRGGIYKCASLRQSINSCRTLVAMSEVLEDNLEEIYRFAIDLGKSAGKILLEGIERRRVTADDGVQEAIEKLNSVDIVTQTDNGMHLGS